MLPDNALSDTPRQAAWVTPLRRTLWLDFEWGGRDLNAPDPHLMHALWYSFYDTETGGIFLINETDGVEREMLTVAGVAELAFAFDQNMQPAVAYRADGAVHLYWFDTRINDFTTTVFEGIANPRLTLDEHRRSQTGSADVLFCYTRGTKLCVRNQRERFEVEHELAEVRLRLWHVGMMTNGRVGFALKNPLDGVQ